MENTKNKYFEEIAEIPEKIAEQNDFEPEIDKGDDTAIEDKKSDNLILETSSDIKKDVKTEKLTDEFKQKIKKTIPSDFDITQIGKIDLQEAEKVANEEIVFLREEDLIEGLEDFELIPLKEISKTIENEDEKKLIPEDISEVKSGFQEKEETLLDDFVIEDFTHEGVTGADPSPATESINSQIEEINDTIVTVTDNLNEPEVLNGDQYKISDVIDVDNPPALSAGESTTDKLKTVQKESLGPDSLLAESFIDDQIIEAVKNDESVEDEVLPDKYTEIYKKQNVHFIDDRYLVKEIESNIPATNDDPLTSRLVRMIDIVKGNSRIIESDRSFPEDRYILEDHNIFDYSDDFSHEEKLITDIDFDFIDNSIIKEDFIHYIQEIDEYFYDENNENKSEISEIMGFDKDEEGAFNDLLFGSNYKDIDIDVELEFINPYIDFLNSSVPKNKNCIYLLDDPNSLLDEEKTSIEADISSESAIVFEEDIREIESILGETSGSYESGNEVSASYETELIQDNISVVFEDITDKVIILDDQENMNQFMKTIPDKRKELAELLAYLDGLFEKLPEDVVRKFAESEYFDLYVKVLKDMGV